MGNKQSTACLAATPAPHNQPPAPLEVSVKSLRLPDVLEKKLPELLEIALASKKSPAEIFFEGLIGMFTVAGQLYLQYWMMQQQFNNGKSPSLALVKDKLKKAGRDPKIAQTLNKYEMELVANIETDGSDTLQKVGGLGYVVKHLKRYFFSKNQPGSKSKITLDKGVLLYGRSGCGKTMIAKAAAEQTDAVFLALKPCDLHRKFHGESEQMIEATFSLARKLKPTIIFLDECEAHFGKRIASCDAGSQFYNSLKTIWLQEWGGLDSQSKANKMTQDNRFDVVILGATNFRDRLDGAFLRRFEKQIEVHYPNEKDRAVMFRKTIDAKIKEDELFTVQMFVEGEDDLFQRLAKKTNKFNGFDIVTLCKNAFNELYAKEAREEEDREEEDRGEEDRGEEENDEQQVSNKQRTIIGLDDFNSHIETQRISSEARQKSEQEHY